MPECHSILGASSAHRWCKCTASVLFTKDMPAETSEHAEEGTRAHELCEYKLKTCLQLPVDELSFTPDKEMNEHAYNYALYVMQFVKANSIVKIEQRVDYSSFIGAEGFGTADCLIINEDHIHVIDFKYGMGVKVDAENNFQMMLYALGAYAYALIHCEHVENIKSVKMSIFQPRIGNISEWDIPLLDLQVIAERIFRPRAQEALSANARFAAGEWCRWCKGRAVCRARTEQFAEIVEDFSKKLPPDLSDEEILEVLKKADDFASWLKDVKEFALTCAVNGKKWDGFKISSRATRKFVGSDESIAQALQGTGVEPYVITKKIRTITELEKDLGKKKFTEVLGQFVEKVNGKESLVPEKEK